MKKNVLNSEVLQSVCSIYDWDGSIGVKAQLSDPIKDKDVTASLTSFKTNVNDAFTVQSEF